MDIKEVLQLTSPDRFIPELAAKDKEGVLAEMTDALVAGSPIGDKETILEMLKSRESLGSTAVGPGVAFPHGRTLAAQDLIIVVARSRKGVPFASMDGEPTHLFFMLIAPPQDTGNQYIRSLAVLTEKMQDDAVREAALRADGYEAFCKVLTEE
ncbi:PTS sugar transporter subunit IIA [bacterium]|nr:PTS sugar transporter subunit IIA [bacterium]MBU1071809.1 PTS sugar transporter subunit IIA [bacterium]MBU1674530.1 PTS sugar transporter subunit IIA [bacterium]